MEKINLEQFLREHQGILLTLSIFLLITIEVVNSKLAFWNIMGMLTAFFSYILLITMVSKPKNNESPSILLFKGILSIFIATFCVWVLFNIIISLRDNLLAIIIWLILMIIPAIKIWVE